jgi:hypothetical protein
MKKFVVGFFLIVSLLFIGFVAGGTIAKYFFVSPGDGLAGAGTAAMLGFLGAGIGLILSIILLRKLEEKARSILAAVLFVAALLLWVIFYQQYKQRQEERERENAELFGDRKPSTEVAPAIAETFPAESSELRLADGTEMGIGMVTVSPEIGKTLRFYSKQQHYELPENVQAIDSLTFKDSRHFVDIATAPPWFVPQYMKLDYGFLQMIAITVQKDWVEVIVNKTNGQTSWVYRPDVSYATWSDFLLNVQSVELLNPTDFPPRIKPMDHASPDESVNANGIFYPVSVKDDWLQVHPDKEVDHDIWVRWKRDGILLVKYSMLS